MSTPQIPDLERILFFKGQLLEAGDLTSLQRSNRELRWLHNRSLHSWGIGVGLGVIGEKGDTAVTVEPGYAVDCLGREIILVEPVVKTLPVVAPKSDYYLIAAYLDDSDQKVAERRPGVCVPPGTVRLTEEPRIEWKRVNQVQDGIELVLARATVQNCRLALPLSLSARRYARPAQQPYIYAAQTPAGSTAWTAWEIGGVVRGWRAVVSTAEARFQATPRYTAHVVGQRYLGAAPGPLIVVGFASLADAKRESFTLEFLLPNLGGGVNPGVLYDKTQGPVTANQMNLYIVWSGIEG